MRLLLPLLLCITSVTALSEWRVVRRRVARSVAITTPSGVSDEMIKQLQRERKERRLLRKKKQKLRELREEIRQLTMHRRRPETIDEAVDATKKPRKDNRWKRKLIAKLKGITRRLDRIERQKKTSMKPNQPVNVVTAIEPTTFVVTTTAASSTTPLLKTSISTPSEDTKMRRIQSSIEQARSGENGTACGSHADCRPGRCCQRSSSLTHSAAICTFHSLGENAPCTDSCQCANRLLCFYPKNNSTKPYCKKAQSSDITAGSYLNEKDGIFLTKSKRK